MRQPLFLPPAPCCLLPRPNRVHQPVTATSRTASPGCSRGAADSRAQAGSGPAWGVGGRARTRGAGRAARRPPGFRRRRKESGERPDRSPPALPQKHGHPAAPDTVASIRPPGPGQNRGCSSRRLPPAWHPDPRRSMSGLMKSRSSSIRTAWTISTASKTCARTRISSALTAACS